MEKFLFADGQSICLYDDGKVKKFPSKFIEKYKENAISLQQSKSCKTSGEGAAFRVDTDVGRGDISFKSSVNGMYPVGDFEEIVYSFTINQTSGIYKKSLVDEKVDEAHIINRSSSISAQGV